MFFNNSIGSIAVGVLEILVVIVLCICAGLIIFTKQDFFIYVFGIIVEVVLIDSIIDEYDEKEEKNSCVTHHQTNSTTESHAQNSVQEIIQTQSGIGAIVYLAEFESDADIPNIESD